jgi:dTDP-4-dehydrorhamnose 3,5-epimerase-like enzyme
MDFKIEYFDKFSDERGDLIVFLRSSNLKQKHKQFGQIYFVTFRKKGIVRANHYHKRIREWFGVVHGKVSVVLEDLETGKKEKLILDSKDNKYIRLEIGPNVAHAFKSVTSTASVVNYTDQEWSQDDVFPHILMK